MRLRLSALPIATYTPFPQSVSAVRAAVFLLSPTASWSPCPLSIGSMRAVVLICVTYHEMFTLPAERDMVSRQRARGVQTLGGAVPLRTVTAIYCSCSAWTGRTYWAFSIVGQCCIWEQYLSEVNYEQHINTTTVDSVADSYHTTAGPSTWYSSIIVPCST